MHDKPAYGKGIADETMKAMNKAGLKETMYEAITQGDKDFTALISKMKQAKLEADRSSERLRAIADNLPVSITYVCA